VDLLPQEVRDRIPQLGMMEGEDDPMVSAKIVNPTSGYHWYLIAMQQLDQDAICYGYIVGWDEELTYFNLSDLDLHAAEVGEPNQLDSTFVPCWLSEVQAQERGNVGKFPLGRVVATPGALEALEATGQHPLSFLTRHARGDWGELDQEDRAENEYSLTHGLRLLSAYTLTDGTRIWIITEADRSATTILLPSEY
jgi:hypothetical protein